VMSPEEVTAIHPGIGLPEGARGVLEPEAGVLLADRILTLTAAWLRRHGRVDLRPYRRVVAVDAGRRCVHLANGERVGADAVLVAAGPWSRTLLSSEISDRLVLRRLSTIHCRVPDVERWCGTPVLRQIGPARDAWLVPPVDQTPLAFSASGAGRTVAGIDGDTTSPRWRDHLLAALATLVPGLSGDNVVGARDGHFLTCAGDGGPMLAVHGDRVISYAACGGSSFKFAPRISQCLSEHLTGVSPTPTGMAFLDDPTFARLPLLRGAS
jgi:sarcosine oxidase